MGSKSWPSAPRPCSQMTLAWGDGPVSISTACKTWSMSAPESWAAIVAKAFCYHPAQLTPRRCTMDFQGQTVLITGAARGIGRASALAFAGLGARVAVHYRSSRAEAEALLEELPGRGHRAFAADLTDPAACAALIDAVAAQFGALQVLVNNAGI